MNGYDGRDRGGRAVGRGDGGIFNSNAATLETIDAAITSIQEDTDGRGGSYGSPFRAQVGVSDSFEK